METLGGKGTCAGIRGVIAVGPEVPSVLGDRRGLEGDGEGTVSVSEVDVEMSAVKSGTYGGGSLLSSNFIVLG